MPTRAIQLPFPIKGLDRHWAYRASPILSSPDALNVRGYGQEGGRLRGGQRAGLTNWSPGTGQLGNHVGTDAFSGTGLNDLTPGGTYTGTGIVTYRVEIDTAAATDKFKWSTDGGVTWTATLVSITGAAQALSLGVTVTFGATTGHTLADMWEFTAEGSPIRLLSSVTTVKTPDTYTGTDEDDFDREDSRAPTNNLGEGWTHPAWILYEGADLKKWEKALKIRHNRVENPGGDRAIAIRTTFGQPEVADGTAYVIQFDIGKHGDGRQDIHVYLQLDDLNPNMANEGIDVTLSVTSNTLGGDVEGRFGVDAADITDFGDITALTLSKSLNTIRLSMVTNSLTITATVNGVTTTVFGPTNLTVSPALQGRTVGIGMVHNHWWLDNWLITGLLLQGTPTTRKTTLIAGTSATFYRESSDGVLSPVSGDAAVLASEYPVLAEEMDGKLYIADYADARVTGSDGIALFPSDAGTWSSVTAYVQGDVVDKGAATHYIAKAASTNKDPATETAYWVNIGTSVFVNSFLVSVTAGDWTAAAKGIVAATDVVVITPDNSTTGPTADAYQITTIAAGYLYLAGSTTNSGGCSFRVEKAPLKYDPATNAVSIWAATSGYGTVPTGCQLIARYRGSLVMARNATDLSNWYMCRMRDPLDWSYGATDYQAAAYYVGGDVGKPGDAITALIPWKDDLLIFGCANSIWLLRGHPKDGGSLDAISYEAGVLAARSWCGGPTGAVYWLGPGGFYGLVSIRGDMNPKNLSEKIIPRDLVGINPENYLIILSYDTRRYGVWISITSKASGASRSWFWDERLNAFWPDRYPSAQDPTAAYNYVADSAARSNLIFGCRDGRLRVFDNAAKDDDGVAIDSYVVYPPQLLGNGDGREGTLTELRADLSENTDRVDYELRASKSFEAAVSATALHSGSWKAGGMRPALHERIRGKALCLRLANANAGKSWEIEQIIGTVLDGGKARY